MSLAIQSGAASNEMLDHVKWAIAKAARTPADTITLDTSLASLSLDSFDTINVAFALEERLGIDIPVDDLRNVTDMRQFVAALIQAVNDKQRRARP